MKVYGFVVGLLAHADRCRRGAVLESADHVRRWLDSDQGVGALVGVCGTGSRSSAALGDVDAGPAGGGRLSCYAGAVSIAGDLGLVSLIGWVVVMPTQPWNCCSWASEVAHATSKFTLERAYGSHLLIVGRPFRDEPAVTESSLISGGWGEKYVGGGRSGSSVNKMYV